MRLQLAIVVLSVGCSTGSHVSTSADVRRFSDDMVTVTSPRVTSSMGDELEISPSWKVDIITAATPTMSAPDTITRATKYSEERHEAGLALDWERDGAAAGGNYSVSVEPDYVSHSMGVSGSREVLNRRATFAAGGAVGINEIGRADVASFEEKLTSLALQLSWSHIINPTLVLEGAYSVEHRRGFQSNPYRLVPIFDPGAARPAAALTERVPEYRTRHAFEGVAIWSLSSTTFAHGAYRFYLDDWGMVSHTVRAELWKVLLQDAVRLRLRLRGYNQSAADFYEQRYEVAAPLRTGDYRLSRMSTVTGGPRVDLRFLQLAEWGGLALTASYDAMLFLLPDYAVLSSMLAHLAGLSISVEVE